MGKKFPVFEGRNEKSGCPRFHHEKHIQSETDRTESFERAEGFKRGAQFSNFPVSTFGVEFRGILGGGPAGIFLLF